MLGKLAPHNRSGKFAMISLATKVFAAIAVGFSLASLVTETMAEDAFGYKIKTDVVYGKGVVAPDGKSVERDLLLDVYTPSQQGTDRPRPAVILIHGGGFQRGGLRQPPYKEAGAVHSRMEDYARLLAPLGYVVFVIEYRLAPEFPEPKTALDADWLLSLEEDITDAGMRRVNFARGASGLAPLTGPEGKIVVWKTILSAAEDLSKAVGFVRSSSNTYDIDPDKLALGGHSAGAATVINAAFGLKAPVAAIFPLSPPVSAIDVTKAISPPDVTPTLHVLSQNDEPAVLEKAPSFTKRMREVGADYELVWVPGFPHFYPTGAVSLGDDGTRMSVGERIIEFLEKNLK
jgi:acetyl esterase/lipase